MGLLSAGEVEAFHERGFLPARPLLEARELEALRSAFHDLMEGRTAKSPELHRNMGDDQNVVIQIVNAWEASPAFRSHLYHPEMVAAVAQLMATDTVRVWHDQIQFKPPQIGGPTQWHQDHPYWPILQPADLVSAWVALEDADEANGCMSMVPRSHRWGAYGDGTIGIRLDDWGPDYDPSFLPKGESVEVVPCPTRAGEVMFHHCLTWHGAPPNRTDRCRPAIAIHYMPGHTRYQPSGTHAVEHLVEVAPGEILLGEHFPTVLDQGRPVTPA